MTTSHFVTPSWSTSQYVQHDPPSAHETPTHTHVSAATTSTINQPDPFGPQQVQDASGDETDSRPRFSAAEKGKRPVAASSRAQMSDEDEPMSEDDPMSGGGEMSGGKMSEGEMSEGEMREGMQVVVFSNR